MPELNKKAIHHKFPLSTMLAHANPALQYFFKEIRSTQIKLPIITVTFEITPSLFLSHLPFGISFALYVVKIIQRNLLPVRQFFKIAVQQVPPYPEGDESDGVGSKVELLDAEPS